MSERVLERAISVQGDPARGLIDRRGRPIDMGAPTQEVLP
jgi:hypothetical protein